MSEEDKKLKENRGSDESGKLERKKARGKGKTSKAPNWKVIAMIVVPIVVALIGLIPTFLSVVRDQGNPTQSPPTGPAMYDFSACAEPCNGSNATTIFVPETKKIYTQWSYRNIPIGAAYVRTWARSGKEWIKYICTWPGPTDGKDVVILSEPKGLRSGVWEMTITINGTVLLREKVQIQGEYTFWDPVGTVNGCYGE